MKKREAVRDKQGQKDKETVGNIQAREGVSVHHRDEHTILVKPWNNFV